MKSLNSITKSIVGAIIFTLIVIWIANRLKNPYTQDIRYRITNVVVPSGLWYNYSIGDTIGKKKQIYFNQ
jgi:hypothetical protein